METMINHPDGVCSLHEIQKDVKAWQLMQGDNKFGFTCKTVQSLINKIVELQKHISDKNHRLI